MSFLSFVCPFYIILLGTDLKFDWLFKFYCSHHFACLFLSINDRLNFSRGTFTEQQMSYTITTLYGLFTLC